MTVAERNNKLKHFITCLKCEVSGKCCDVNCSTQYAAGNIGEIIENLEAISKVLEQEPKFIAKSDGTIEQIIKFTIKEDKEMELRDTVAMMESEDYKERFKAEYYQTKIRYNKLHKMTIKYEAGKLDFEPSCPLRLLLEQKRCMGAYLHALEVRAQIEGIDLEEAQA
jgi:hypothetical protein